MNLVTVQVNELISSQIWKAEYFQHTSDSPKDREKYKSLRELVSQRKESFDPKKTTKIPSVYVGLEDVEPIVGLLKRTNESEVEVKSVSKRFYKGDILFGRLRPTLNKILYVDTLDDEFGVCSNEFIVLTPNLEIVEPVYLRAALSSHDVQEVIKKYQSGSTLPRIYADDLLDIDILLPSMPEQKKIVSKISDLTDEYTKASSALERIRSEILESKLLG